jgi:hypothetical protein
MDQTDPRSPYVLCDGLRHDLRDMILVGGGREAQCKTITAGVHALAELAHNVENCWNHPVAHGSPRSAIDQTFAAIAKDSKDIRMILDALASVAKRQWWEALA